MSIFVGQTLGLFALRNRSRISPRPDKACRIRDIKLGGNGGFGSLGLWVLLHVRVVLHLCCSSDVDFRVGEGCSLQGRFPSQ